MATTREVLTDMPDRLRAAGKDVKDAELELRLARTRRNVLIVQAVDEGMVQTKVAELAGVKPPHIVRILGQHDAEGEVTFQPPV